jgi:hypothetical protein
VTPPELPGATATGAPEPEGGKSDQYKALAVLGALLVGGGALKHDWVAAHQSLALATVFVMGYAGIIFEGASRRRACTAACSWPTAAPPPPLILSPAAHLPVTAQSSSASTRAAWRC